jgi:hypothetical protein
MYFTIPYHCSFFETIYIFLVLFSHLPPPFVVVVVDMWYPNCTASKWKENNGHHVDYDQRPDIFRLVIFS